MADVKQWITVHPNGADSKGQPVPVKEGQSKGEAVKSFINKHKSKVKELNKKSIDELKKEITQDSNDDKIMEAKAKELFAKLKRGEYLEVEELKNHPVVKWLNKKEEEARKKYGDTSKLPGREKKREKWLKEFLSTGSMVVTGKDNNGRDIYEAKGPLKKEFKAVIVTGLPAAGKSSRIVNPLSRDIGGFVFDNDEIKQLIDEFKESNGAAASSVHNESKMIQDKAFKEFLSGGERNGQNLIIPKIGDDADSLQDKFINKLEDAGYDVEIQYNPASLKDSLNRVAMRGIETGRIIPTYVVESYGDGPAKTFEYFKNKLNKKGKPFVRKGDK